MRPDLPHHIEERCAALPLVWLLRVDHLSRGENIGLILEQDAFFIHPPDVLSGCLILRLAGLQGNSITYLVGNSQTGTACGSCGSVD